MCLQPLEVKDKLGIIRQVPCGQCLECRIKRAFQWKLRLLHELYNFDKACFITLTYDNEHLPENGTLVKEDLQKFFKRLRRYYQYKNGDNAKLKYFACGEYGDKLGRPHYHAIIFGLSPVGDDRRLIQSAWKFCKWDKISCKAIGTVTSDSIMYTCGYITKKIFGKSAKSAYEEKGLIAPFQLQSQGLGLKYCLAHQELWQEQGYLNFNGKEVALPRYYKNKICLNNHVRTLDSIRRFAIERDRKEREYWTQRALQSSEFLQKSYGEIKEAMLTEQYNEEFCSAYRSPYEPSFQPSEYDEQPTKEKMIYTFVKYHRSRFLLDRHRRLLKQNNNKR